MARIILRGSPAQIAAVLGGKDTLEIAVEVPKESVPKMVLKALEAGVEITIVPNNQERPKEHIRKETHEEPRPAFPPTESEYSEPVLEEGEEDVELESPVIGEPEEGEVLPEIKTTSAGKLSEKEGEELARIVRTRHRRKVID